MAITPLAPYTGGKPERGSAGLNSNNQEFVDYQSQVLFPYLSSYLADELSNIFNDIDLKFSDLDGAIQQKINEFVLGDLDAPIVKGLYDSNDYVNIDVSQSAVDPSTLNYRADGTTRDLSWENVRLKNSWNPLYPSYPWAYDDLKIVRDRFVSGATFILAGDSLVDNFYNENIQYMTELCAYIGVNVVDNARSGETAENWLNNIFTGSSLNDAIAATPGTGSTTLLKFPFGTNDWQNGTPAQVKTWIKDSIQAYLTAKPDAVVLLEVPNHTSNEVRDSGLKTIYYELAKELDLPLINSQNSNALTYFNLDKSSFNPEFQNDATHANRYGNRRKVHYILNEITSDEQKLFIKMQEFTELNAIPPNVDLAKQVDDTNIAGTIQNSYYITTSGEIFNTNASWRRLSEIDVVAGQHYRIRHQGNRLDVIWRAGNTYISNENHDGSATIIVQAPLTATKLRINVSDSGTVYDALNDIPIVEKVEIERGYYNTSSGLKIVEDNWRRLKPLIVDDKFDLAITHQGSLFSVLFMDSVGGFISRVDSAVVAGEIYRSVKVPVGAVEARINLNHINEQAYDELNNNPIVRQIKKMGVLNIDSINHGLDIKLRKL